MFVPWRAEIPGGHRPWATLLLVAANIAVASVVGFADGTSERALDWVVTESGFDVVHWLRASLVHVDGLHLVGNLFFLWAFGLVVEGVAGFGWFLALTWALALVSGGAQAHFGAAAAAQGASGVVLGLMLGAAIWAPWARMRVFVWFLVRAPQNARTTALPLCLFYLAWIVLEIVGFGVHPALGPTGVSVAAGAVFAFALRWAGWVEPLRVRSDPDAADRTEL